MTKFAQILAACLLCCSSFTFADSVSLSPSLDLEADEVIRIVVEALQTNDSTADDKGIATVYRFASPGNKSMTGPLARFRSMIKGGFAVMLNHASAEYSEVQINENKARQAVWLTTLSGDQHGFMFEVGKQIDGEFEGMWMTDAVWPIGVRKAPGQSI